MNFQIVYHQLLSAHYFNSFGDRLKAKNNSGLYFYAEDGRIPTIGFSDDEQKFCRSLSAHMLWPSVTEVASVELISRSSRHQSNVLIDEQINN